MWHLATARRSAHSYPPVEAMAPVRSFSPSHGNNGCLSGEYAGRAAVKSRGVRARSALSGNLASPLEPASGRKTGEDETMTGGRTIVGYFPNACTGFP